MMGVPPVAKAFLLTVMLAAAEPPASFYFPVNPETVRDATGSFEVSFRDPGKNRDGIHEYKLIVSRRADARELAELTFTRSVIGAWSGASLLYVNDYVGSNATDCLVLNPSQKSPFFISLLELIKKSVYQIAPTATAKRDLLNALWSDHVYLTCDKWVQGNRILVSVRSLDKNGDVRVKRLEIDASKMSFGLIGR